MIGGHRSRYRSLGTGDAAPRGNIDPFIGIGFKLGLKVDSSGTMPDGRTFAGLVEFQNLLTADKEKLLNNLGRHFAVYSTGRGVSFADRDDIAAIAAASKAGGIRTLLYELTTHQLFRTR
ncbi:MAG: DUF1585 domain-containing protein [Gemmataceae bacterium]